jgi:hypothetical protein
VANAALVESVRRKYEALKPLLNERLRRHWAEAEAQDIGWGGITTVAQATGLSQTIIAAGLREQQAGVSADEAGEAPHRVRRPGGGRKTLVEHDTRLLNDLESLVDPVTRGDPQSPLRWTCKSTRKLWPSGRRSSMRSVTAITRSPVGRSSSPFTTIGSKSPARGCCLQASPSPT